MKRRMLLAAVVALAAVGTGFGDPAQVAPSDVPASLAAYAQSVLLKEAQAPAIVQYIDAQNAHPARVADLKALDQRWAAAQGVEAYMWDLMRNRLAFVLADFQYRHKFVMEAFAMDAQGAIVAESNRTSTFYKGEAQKFTAAYNGGDGKIWFGPAAYDDSTAETEVQVSVPVTKGRRTIGVITFGISLDRWEERKPE